MAAIPVTFAPEEYEKLRLSLKQINLKARRIQIATAMEMELLKLQWRFASFVEYIGPLQKGISQDRVPLDREWRNFKRLDIPTVRGYIIPAGGAPAVDPVAQRELNGLITSGDNLNTQIAGGNWGNVDQLSQQFQTEIESAIAECRSVTEEELRQIYTITVNL